MSNPATITETAALEAIYAPRTPAARQWLRRRAPFTATENARHYRPEDLEGLAVEWAEKQAAHHRHFQNLKNL